MNLSTSDNRQIDSLVKTVFTCLSFLSEQAEHEEGYLIGIQHTIQNLVASVIEDILQTEGRDIDSVSHYMKFDEYTRAFDEPLTVERNEMIREKIKADIINFMKFIEDNIEEV